LVSSSTSSLAAPAEDAFLFFAIMISCWLLCGKIYQMAAGLWTENFSRDPCAKSDKVRSVRGFDLAPKVDSNFDSFIIIYNGYDYPDHQNLRIVRYK
jgi:hypothetical protein